MMNTNRLRFQKGDILAIGFVVVLAAAVFLCFLPGQESAGVLQVYQEGKLIRTVSLAEDQQFTVSGAYTNTVTVQSGAVAVTHSDCPGEDCVGCGWMDSPGRSIVCLPNALELRLVGVDTDVDFVVG